MRPNVADLSGLRRGLSDERRVADQPAAAVTPKAGPKRPCGRKSTANQEKNGDPCRPQLRTLIGVTQETNHEQREVDESRFG